MFFSEKLFTVISFYFLVRGLYGLPQPRIYSWIAADTLILKPLQILKHFDGEIDFTYLLTVYSLVQLFLA